MKRHLLTNHGTPIALPVTPAFKVGDHVRIRNSLKQSIGTIVEICRDREGKFYAYITIPESIKTRRKYLEGLDLVSCQCLSPHPDYCPIHAV